MTTPVPGERRRHRRWPWIMFVVVAAVVAWSTIEFVDDDYVPLAAVSPEMNEVLRPWAPIVGTCRPVPVRSQDRRRTGVDGVRRCEVRDMPGAPDSMTFTLYRSAKRRERAQRMRPDATFVYGPRSDGFVVAADAYLAWEHGRHPARIELRWPASVDAPEVLAWWDRHAPVSGASPPASSGTPGPSSAMSYPLRQFSASWHRDLRRCERVDDDRIPGRRDDVVLDVDHPSSPTRAPAADELVVCALRGRSGWRRAGGFEQIRFLRWDTRGKRGVYRGSLIDAYGWSRDQLGSAGRRSGHVAAAKDRGRCVLYWEDQAVAVAATVVTDCPPEGRPTLRTLRAFWKRHR